MQVVPFHQSKELADLVWFGFPVFLLQIDQFAHLGMRKDVMTAFDAR